MSLFICFVEQKDREKYFNKNILLNTSRVVDFRTDSDDETKTIMYYNTRDDRREGCVTLRLSHDLGAVWLKIREANNEPIIPIQVDKVGRNLRHTYDIAYTVYYVNAEKITWGFDLDTVSSEIWVERNAFDILKLKNTHTIAQIDARASVSTELSLLT